MKKIAYVGNKNNFEIYKILHTRIKEVKNLNSELYHVEDKLENLDDYLKEYDAAFFEDNLKNKYDFIFKKDNLVEKIFLKKIAFKELLKYSNFKIENSNVLILETNEYFNAIYEALKENQINKIHLASIKSNNTIKLEKGEYFKNFLDIERLNNIDLIINLTDIGSMFNFDESPLKRDTNITAKFVLDLVKIPLETTLLKQFKQKGSTLINGIDLTIIEIIMLLLLLFDRKDIYYFEFIKQLHVYIYKKINPRTKDNIDEITTSKEFLKLLKGHIK
ncbi:hypothetical protein [Streptobacillus moniliformis]|uniref:hypothetical protein n=1 Tax=Streptobacillus moniliformis TaxID=34105 RepID=UPI0007E3FEC6|nr:hypothetical protein [Streptobacillus moniliformis]